MNLFRPLLGILFLLLLGIGADCVDPSPGNLLNVDYAGCRAVLPGLVCVLDASRELRLWVEAPPAAQIEILAAGEQIKAAGEPVQDGQTFSLTAPPGAERIDVLVETREGRASWSMRLAEPESQESRGPLVQQIRQGMSRDLIHEAQQTAGSVYDLLGDHQLTAAREKLDGFRLPSKAPAEARCIVAYYRAMLAEKEGDYRSALAEIQKAVEIAQRVNEEHFQWQAGVMQALFFSRVGRSRESAELFERLSRTPHAATSCDKAQLLNNQAWSTLLAREAGESFGDPTPLFERALETYESCQKFTPGKRLNILLNLALAHLKENRLTQARDLLAQARVLEDHAALLQRLWWLDLKARIALLEERPAEALRLFEDLEELAAETSSPDGRLRAVFGQARSHEALEDRPTALEAFQKAEALLDEQSFQVPLHEGRETFMATRQAVVSQHIDLLLEEGQRAEALAVARNARSRMLRQLERSDRLASLSPERRVRWERLLTEYQERRSALEEREKDGWGLPDDQRPHDQIVRKAEAEALKKLLDQAFLLLVDPGERLREAPPPPRAGELILVYHPLPDGWAGFAADGKTVKVHRFELPPGRLLPDEELARRLLFPFRASIRQARRIRILPSGPLQNVDFHALPFDGDVLLASSPVIYGLDLPVSTGLTQSPGRHALLVADPREDLPGTLTEARMVRKVLEFGSTPWITEELKNVEATAEAVRDRLAAADLLHYAGHGTFSGFGGWESSLLLAEETRLTLGDLLALERVPAWVVLSGCDTGQSSAETPVESLGLAHAFLLAGSKAVVASTRRADDRTVPAFFSELYRQWRHEADLALAFQRAQLSWRERNPGADWQGFRLFEP